MTNSIIRKVNVGPSGGGGEKGETTLGEALENEGATGPIRSRGGRGSKMVLLRKGVRVGRSWLLFDSG